MIAVALAVFLQDGGPVVFAHRRIGRGGRYFHCYKFRSMAIDAEQRLAEVLATDPVARAEWARDHKLRNDPRVTRLGAFLRKTSLDELPQLFNVLRGDMALVGPRPTSFHAETYELWQTERLELRPGITGPWQVWGRSTLDFEDRCRLEISFFRSAGVRQTVRVLFSTVGALLRRSGVA
jgi:lipopolysaccharide/colanic/teichoic acid biosynthesis glycosyltransferase